MTALHPQNCETCKFMDNGNFEDSLFGLRYCFKCDMSIEPIFFDQVCCCGCASHSSAVPERDIGALKKAIVEVLDTGFESSERDMVLVLDRIDAWEKGELRQQGGRE
jgi:hypothetical protein